MAFREVSVVQIREALRRWLRGEGERPIAKGVGVDRKTARRYIIAAVELGIDRGGGEEQVRFHGRGEGRNPRSKVQSLKSAVSGER